MVSPTKAENREKHSLSMRKALVETRFPRRYRPEYVYASREYE